MRIRREASAVLLLVGVWGCGGSGSSAKNFDSGLAEDLALQDVSPADKQAACEDLRSTVESRFPASANVRFSCEMFSALLTTDEAACEARADSCVQESENGGSDIVVAADQVDFSNGLDCDATDDVFAGCSVTVGEYEDCLNSQFSQVEELFAKFSCAQAGTLTIQEVQDLGNTASPQNPACEKLEAECPAAVPFSESEATR